MNSYIKKACLIFAASACASLAYAQSSLSSYFLEGSDYRFQENPAFGNEHGFVGTLFSDLSIGLGGNLNLKDVIYTRNGKTVLFTNPYVDTQEFLNNISDRNKLNLDFKYNLFSVGFKAFNGYNTVSINAKATTNVMVPGSLFSLAKEGLTNKTYDITDFAASAQSYAELALNHSRDISQVPGLRVGATAKILFGLGRVDAYFNKAQLALNEDAWSATTNADVYASIKSLSFDTDVNENTGHRYVSGMDLDSFGLNGMGFAVDLGAEYQYQDWKFSAAFLDLGFMNWSETHHASTNGDQTISTDAYTFNVDGDAENNFDDELDRLGDDLSRLYELEDNGNIGSRTTALAATMNIGAQYELPVYRNLNFGLLNTTRFGKYSWTEFRLSANIRPIYFFSASVNAVVGTYGAGFGWQLNIGNKGPKLHIGMDRMLSKLAKQGVPLNSNVHFNFGVSFGF